MGLTKGHAIVCCDRNRRGGLKRIWLMEKQYLATTVVYNDAGEGPGNDTVGGEIKEFDSTGLAASTPLTTDNAAWFEFEFDRGTAGFNANATRENGSTLVNVELEFYIPKITEEINGILRQLTESCGIFAIVETYADDCDDAAPETYFFLLGYDSVFEDKAYMEFASGEQSTGVGLQDANGCTVKLAGVQAEYPREIMILLNTTTSASGTNTDWVDMYQPVAGVTAGWVTV